MKLPGEEQESGLVFVPGQLEDSGENAADIRQHRQHERYSDNAEKQTEKSALECLCSKIPVTCTDETLTNCTQNLSSRGRYHQAGVEGDKFIDIFIISVIIQTLCVQIIHGRYQ